jgi:hypothetical protein
MLWGADVLICDLKLLLPKIQLFRTENMIVITIYAWVALVRMFEFKKKRKRKMIRTLAPSLLRACLIVFTGEEG